MSIILRHAKPKFSGYAPANFSAQCENQESDYWKEIYLKCSFLIDTGDNSKKQCVSMTG